MITLFIDTSKREEIIASLSIDGKISKKTQTATMHTSQMLLPLVDALLKENNLAITDVQSISVNPGPGSFTGLRVGIAIANTLSYMLHIPVNGKKFEGGLLVVPSYS